MSNSKKCVKCGDTEDLWYEPMMLLGISDPSEYILCGHCLSEEYEGDDEI
tara:strand:+ start:190 stop:339 length:150 start_codon:yes stop_codon:yes gene_type:complete